MTRKNLMAGGLLVGSLVLGFAGQAEAANLVQKYDVTQYSNSHAVWLKGLQTQGFTNNAHFLFEEPGRLNVYDDGTASLTGVIYNKGSNQGISNENKKWDVDIKFNLVEDYEGGLKNPTGNTGVSNQYAYDNWSFWEFAEGSVLTGMGDYEGSEINLYNRAFDQANRAEFLESGKDPKVRGQLGIGANDKNGDLGFSVWFGYNGNVGDTTYTNDSDQNWTKSDINVKLTAVPEPATMSLMSLGMMGLGASVLKRKKES